MYAGRANAIARLEHRRNAYRFPGLIRDREDYGGGTRGVAYAAAAGSTRTDGVARSPWSRPGHEQSHSPVLRPCYGRRTRKAAQGEASGPESLLRRATELTGGGIRATGYHVLAVEWPKHRSMRAISLATSESLRRLRPHAKSKIG